MKIPRFWGKFYGFLGMTILKVEGNGDLLGNYYYFSVGVKEFSWEVGWKDSKVGCKLLNGQEYKG